MAQYCKRKRVTHCTSEIKDEIEALFPNEVHARFQAYAHQLVSSIPSKKRKRQFLVLLRKIEQITGTREQMALYFNVCKILEYAATIPSFQNDHVIQKWLSHQHQALTTLYISSNSALDAYRSIGNPNGPGSFLIHSHGKNWGVYKVRGHLSEVAAWELSLMLGCEEAIASSSSLFSHDRSLVFQTYQKARFLKGLFYHPAKKGPKIREWNFWKTNLFLYVLGHMDMTQCNIGVTKNMTLYICDNEDIFSTDWDRRFSREEGTLYLPLMNMMVDWPEAMRPLSRKGRALTKKLIQDWKSKRVDIERYLHHPFNDFSLDAAQEQAFNKRLDRLFEVEAFTTFAQFIHETFPHFYNGISELTAIVEPIMGAKVSEMSLLLFISKCRSWWDRMTPEVDKKLIECLEKYDQLADDGLN